MSTAPHTLADIAKRLNRPAVVISGLQNRFDLPAFEGAGYSDAYLAFLKTVVCLRTLGIAEDRLLRLWLLEKKLLQLLDVDSTGSRTWFLDSCGAITSRDRRLLLSNYDGELPQFIGFEVSRNKIPPRAQETTTTVQRFQKVSARLAVRFKPFSQFQVLSIFMVTPKGAYGYVRPEPPAVWRRGSESQPGVRK